MTDMLTRAFASIARPPQHIIDNANPAARAMLARMGLISDGAAATHRPTAHVQRPQQPTLRIDIVANMKKRFEERRPAR